MSADKVSTIATLRTRDGETVTCVCQFSVEDWECLGRFVDYARDLVRTALLSTPGRIEFSLSASDDGVRFEPVALPSEDEFSALLLRMRPFVLQNENTYFYNIVKILSRRLDHPVFQAYLDRQRQIFNGRRCQAMKMYSNGTLINSSETLDLWLNAYEYHGDQKKRQQFDAMHSESLPMGFSRAMLISIMLERARGVVEIGNAIYAIRQGLEMTPLPGDDDPIWPPASQT